MSPLRESDSDQPIEHVSDTSFWVAAYRALETKRPDALFHDPLAGELAEGKGVKIAKALGNRRQMAWSIALRTVIIDDYIREAIAGGVDTVLNLGAGLDTRPYRLDLPENLRWIEVDFPSVITYKTARLGGEPPKCDLERIALDLSDANARERLFSHIGARSARLLVLTEGVIPYLDNDSVAALATDFVAQRSFAYWITDYFSAEFMELYRKGRIGVARRLRKNAPFRFFPGEWEKFFARTGWTLGEMRYLADEGNRRGRPTPIPWPMRLILRFIPPTRRQQMTRMTGYALLKRAAL